MHFLEEIISALPSPLSLHFGSMKSLLLMNLTLSVSNSLLSWLLPKIQHLLILSTLGFSGIRVEYILVLRLPYRTDLSMPFTLPSLVVILELVPLIRESRSCFIGLVSKRVLKLLSLSALFANAPKKVSLNPMVKTLLWLLWIV
uniref:Uncharacterized protein n=1 Tax=Arundo donax TaxID=35708 RepID=A0A0A8YZJ7_ARUDO